MKRAIVALFAVCSVASLALAETPAAKTPAVASVAAAPPAPSPELKQFGKWFVGNYPTCQANWNASPMGPAHAAKGTAKVEWALDGSWIMSHYTEAKSKDNPAPWHVVEMFSHDGKQFKRVGFDSFGGLMVGQVASPDTDQIRFAGQMEMAGGEKAPAKVTFAKKGEKETTYTFQMQAKDGQWIDLGGGVCKKK